MAAVKKAFNNPVVVGVLVLLAAAFVLRDFIHFSPRSSLKTTTPSTTQKQTPTPSPVIRTKKISAPSVKTATLKHTNWQRIVRTPLPDRDIFAPDAASSEQAVADATAKADGETSTIRLRAIVAAKHILYASINDRLLRAGDTIDGWELVAIGRDRVQLRGRDGLMTLDIDGGMHMGGKRLQPTGSSITNGQDAIPMDFNRENAQNPDMLFDSMKKTGIVSRPALYP